MNRTGVVTRRTLEAYWPHHRLNNRLQPLPKHGCIYVKNAKAGTSTTLLWLYRIHTGDHRFTPASGSIHAEHHLPSLGEVGWDTTLRMLSGEAFRFSFVRDPIRRAESAYADKIVHAPVPERRTQLQRLLGLPEDPDQVPTFDQFVASLDLEDPLAMNPHWRPQHLNLMHDAVEYDLVGRLESYDADLARVGEAIGVAVPAEIQNAASDPARYTDGRPDLVRRLSAFYARDLELYGY